jgi:pimeloyl-ACP methyl ester carboxylesterase
MRRIRWKWLLGAVALVLVLVVVGFVVWANNPLAPTPEALTALLPDTEVIVSQQNGWTVFTPTAGDPVTGFIFYPGGRVDARAYAPQLHAIAARGYLTILIPMPLNLAIFGLNSAADVVKAFPNVKHWAIGGHSLGGSMAARFVQGNPTAMQGLVFWASYPDIDLSQSGLKALSIYGTSDAVAKSDGIQNSHNLLPADAAFVAIEGGNHSQFGAYGLQPGDNAAGISAAEQLDQTVKATADLLKSLSEPAS